MALGRKTGGRTKGVPNKVTAETAKAVASSGLTPLEYMLRVLRDEGAETGKRLDAAKAAAPYIHCKMPIRNEITGKDGEAIKTEQVMNDAESFVRSIASIAARSGASGTA